jgi:hypothetical protein
MNVRKTQAKKKQNPAMKTINGRTYEQGWNLERKEIISLLTPNVLGVLLVIKSRPKERFSLQSTTTFLKDDYTANNAFS